MLFQSSGFLVFFTVFFFIYWSLSFRVKARNFLLLAASLCLYSLWDIRFTALLTGIILLNFIAGRKVDKDTFNGRSVFWTALILNIVPLVLFKYYNFFTSNLNVLFSFFGLSLNMSTIGFLLPVGISFYTFLSLSYLIDVYRKQIEPERDLVNYALSISYFPIIMSGPIHRPRIFLDQIKKEIRFGYDLAAEGCRQILTGLFYKVVIADNIAKQADMIFRDQDKFSGPVLLLGSIYFTFQLYFDFNGYSEMAIGISKLLGIRLNRNFKFPYLSRTISDFWKRWHISLTEWFRDYVFLPVSYIFSRKVKPGSFWDKDIIIYCCGIIVTWTLTGLWHGAGWNYIIWGMIHGSLLILNRAFSKTKKKIIKKAGLKKNSLVVIIYESILTFTFVNLAWIFFRSETAGKALGIIKRLPEFSGQGLHELSMRPLYMTVLILIFEYIQRNREFLFDISERKVLLRWLVYFFAAVLVIYYSGNDSSFIYMGF